MEIKQRNAAWHWIPEAWLQFSSAGYHHLLCSHEYPGPEKRQKKNKIKKSMLKKALNSCSISPFTRGIIKGGFQRLSQFPNQPVEACSKSFVHRAEEMHHMGILLLRVCRNGADWSEGQTIDKHCVFAVYSKGIYTSFAVFKRHLSLQGTNVSYLSVYLPLLPPFNLLGDRLLK